MSQTPSSQIIFDHIWQPLVHVSDTQLAYLVHPGTTQKPQPLSAGWHWHWPWLTSIRSLSLHHIEFHFSQQPKPGHQYYDEPITAVSRNHQLFTGQGIITLSINPHASAEVLSQLNRHAIKRVIRPIIRQAVRQSVAQFEAEDISSEQVAQKLVQLAQPLLEQHGLIIHQVSFSNLDYYHNPMSRNSPG